MATSARPAYESDPLLTTCNENLGERRRTASFRYWAISALMCAGSIKPICFNLIFPFINQMILENKIVSSPEETGLYSGTVESLFSVFAMITIIPWTYASDYYGRKPIVLYGRVGMALSLALFGMSKSLWMMIVTRCICGLFGGTHTTIRVMVAEAYTENSNRIVAFSALQISVRVGEVTGISLGSWLSHPELRMTMFDTYFWREYPFALPCFVACAMGLVSWLYGTVVLHETLPSRQEPTIPAYNQRSDSSTTSRAERRTLLSSMTPQVNAMLTSAFMMTFISGAFYALYLSFALTPCHLGGLGFTEAQIGTQMAIRAFLIVCVIMFSSPLQRHIGTLRTYQLGMMTWPFSVAFLPILSKMANSEEYNSGHPSFWIVFSVFSMCWASGNLVWPCIQILTVNTTPTPEELAVVSGLSQLAQSMGEALAPISITSLHTYSMNHNILGGYLTFVVFFALCSACLIQTIKLKDETKSEFKPIE